MAEEKTIKFSVLVPESQHTILKQAALDNKSSMQRLMRRAVDIVIAEIRAGHSGHKPGSTPPEQPQVGEKTVTILLAKTKKLEEHLKINEAERAWVERLILVLRSNNQIATDAITHSLTASELLVDLTHGRTAPDLEVFITQKYPHGITDEQLAEVRKELEQYTANAAELQKRAARFRPDRGKTDRDVGSG
jgi:hypothetical protein